MAERSPLALLSLAGLALAGLAGAEGGAGDRAAPHPSPGPSAVATSADGGVADGGVSEGGVADGGPAPPSTASAPAPPLPEAPRRSASDPIHPPPLHVEYAQYGVALLALVNLDSGAMCGDSVHSSIAGRAPCILGSGGGLIIRGGYRSPGPWYIGGAYAFAKMDSSNLFRLGILQQLWAEMRYLPVTGYRVAPFATWGLGGVVYGNEWGVETGGAMLFAGGGLQFEVSRVAVVGLSFVYKPALIIGWTDTASYVRPTGVANFFGLDLQLEVRSETGRQ